MIIFLNRLPIPNLRHYSYFSFSLLAIVLIYAQKIAYDLSSDSVSALVLNTLQAVLDEPWCLWVLINLAYCLLLLFSQILQGAVFGKLRVVEAQRIKDQFWNFVFLKFIFIFGVLNLEDLDEVARWCCWFSVLGFLSIHSQLCKDRFEYLAFSAATPLRAHIRVLCLLASIQIVCCLLLVTPFILRPGLSTGLFLFAEAFGLFLRTLYIIAKYSLHLSEIHGYLTGQKGTISYYTDFGFEVTVVGLDFGHYLHMLVYGNFYLSMASLVICMELKRLFVELRRRLRRHSNYLRVLDKMERKFPWATPTELANTDKCAVCWEDLEAARRLPCSHIFHQNCLRSWLEQDTSCPTCRKSLNDDKDAQQHQQLPRTTVSDLQTDQTSQPAPPTQPQPQQQIVHRSLFHFDGSRYISWLPSFSLQVTNNATVLPGLLTNRVPLNPDRLNEMTTQVAQMFAHISTDLIQQDLQNTHSVEATIENILEDRLFQATNLPNETHTQQNRDNNDSDNDDLDELFGPDSSGDEDLVIPMNSVNDNLNANNNVFSSILNNLSQASSASRTSRSQRNTQTVSDPAVLSQEADARIFAKYSEKPELSETANSLIQRKRQLVLNSKKRFLEKTEGVKDLSKSLNEESDNNEQSSELRHRATTTTDNNQDQERLQIHS